MDDNDRRRFEKGFLTDTDHTGRFVVLSIRTGKKYFIEPIGPDRSADWGSYNPGTGKIEHKKGFDKFRGAIDESDSMLTEANGFSDVRYSGVGASPFHVISEMDARHPSIN